jgi:hypothetical protein
VASEGYHERVERLRPDVVERHPAITSSKEELEAVD